MVYTGMSLGFRVHFHHFWYMDGWVSVTDPMRQICKIECRPYLGKLAKKAPFAQFPRDPHQQTQH